MPADPAKNLLSCDGRVRENDQDGGLGQKEVIARSSYLYDLIITLQVSIRTILAVMMVLEFFFIDQEPIERAIT